MIGQELPLELQGLDSESQDPFIHMNDSLASRGISLTMSLSRSESDLYQSRDLRVSPVDSELLGTPVSTVGSNLRERKRFVAKDLLSQPSNNHCDESTEESSDEEIDDNINETEHHDSVSVISGLTEDESWWLEKTTTKAGVIVHSLQLLVLSKLPAQYVQEFLSGLDAQAKLAHGCMSSSSVMGGGQDRRGGGRPLSIDSLHSAHSQASSAISAAESNVVVVAGNKIWLRLDDEVDDAGTTADREEKKNFEHRLKIEILEPQRAEPITQDAKALYRQANIVALLYDHTKATESLAALKPLLQSYAALNAKKSVSTKPNNAGNQHVDLVMLVNAGEPIRDDISGNRSKEEVSAWIRNQRLPFHIKVLCKLIYFCDNVILTMSVPLSLVNTDNNCIAETIVGFFHYLRNYGLSLPSDDISTVQARRRGRGAAIEPSVLTVQLSYDEAEAEVAAEAAGIVPVDPFEEERRLMVSELEDAMLQSIRADAIADNSSTTGTTNSAILLAAPMLLMKRTPSGRTKVVKAGQAALQVEEGEEDEFDEDAENRALLKTFGKSLSNGSTNSSNISGSSPNTNRSGRSSSGRKMDIRLGNNHLFIYLCLRWFDSFYS